MKIRNLIKILWLEPPAPVEPSIDDQISNLQSIADRRKSLKITMNHVDGEWCGSNQCSACARIKTAYRATRHWLGECYHSRKCPVCSSSQFAAEAWHWAFVVWIRFLEARARRRRTR